MNANPHKSQTALRRGNNARLCCRGYHALAAGLLLLMCATAAQARGDVAGEVLEPAAQAVPYADEAAFFADNATRPGVVTTASGLQYQVLAAGKGRKPRSKDTVRVVYTGTLLNGTVFDRVVDRKQPLSFEVGSVIAGWTEALRLMPVHSRYKIWIPSKLAYGEKGIPGTIPPGSVLVFDLELLDAF